MACSECKKQIRADIKSIWSIHFIEVSKNSESTIYKCKKCNSYLLVDVLDSEWDLLIDEIKNAIRK